jgi:NADH dehydrogenase [ubiquinone] 1 alpha subcomplex assembly factor 7
VTEAEAKSEPKSGSAPGQTGALLALLQRRIRIDGPLTVAEFMMEALSHPRHGYYMTADPFGAAGDFVTAPEISQMFGELIGLWCAQCWEQLGRPRAVTLVELGPGRGTLMADALRAVSGVLPAFAAACRLALVETSPVLRHRQAEALAPYTPVWHDRLADVADGPLLVVANEFFDALPVRQFQLTPGGWAERLVDLHPETGDLCFGLDRPGRPSTLIIPPRLRTAGPPELPVGTVIDLAPTAQSIALELGRRLARWGGAALVVDYGHNLPVPTDTLQAVRRHTPVPVLDCPGEADLTAHVDFGALAAAAADGGAIAYGPVTQGDLLRTLGIEARAARLRRTASTRQARDLDAAVHRLTADDAMGRLFKALALTGQHQPAPAGFETSPVITRSSP